MKHDFAKEDFDNSSDEIKTAIQFEANAEYFLAAEKFLAIANRNKDNQTNHKENSKLFSRAASCFELVNQYRDAALTYYEAASILFNNKIEYQLSGELFNRAALNFKKSGEFFNAGSNYCRAARAFKECKDDKLNSKDNIPPVPAGAGKYTFAAKCFEAATDAFIEAKNLAWARSSSWEAGQMHVKQSSGYHAYVAFRKALTLCIQFDQTHNEEHLRKAFPMTKEERDNKVSPIKILEEAAYKGKSEHQKINQSVLDGKWVLVETDNLMIAAFHEFYLEFLKIENFKEAKNYHILKKERQKQKSLRERKFGKYLGFLFWKVTCQYGNNIGRWIAVCSIAILFFSCLYCFFGLISPVKNWFDNIYFSIITMTSLGYGDIQPSGTGGKIVACFEILLGLAMFGMLVTFLNKNIFDN